MRITNDVWSIGAVMISGALGLWGSLLVAWRSTAALFWLALHVWRTLDAWSTNVIPMVPWALLKSLRYFNALCKMVIRSEKGCSYQQIFYVYICIFCIFSNLFIIIFHLFFLFVFFIMHKFLLFFLKKNSLSLTPTLLCICSFLEGSGHNSWLQQTRKSSIASRTNLGHHCTKK